MKTSLFVSALLIAAFTTQAHCAVTEKLAANAEKIAHIKQQISSGELSAKRECGKDKCGRTCKACGSWKNNVQSKCDSRGGCSVKA